MVSLTLWGLVAAGGGMPLATRWIDVGLRLFVLESSAHPRRSRSKRSHHIQIAPSDSRSRSKTTAITSVLRTGYYPVPEPRLLGHHFLLECFSRDPANNDKQIATNTSSNGVAPGTP